MQGRRRDEPCNPFSPGARNKRKAQRDRAGPKSNERGAAKESKSQAPSDIGQLRKKALEQMKKKNSADSAKESQKSATTTSRKESQPKQAKQSREDRLAELRRKSEASVRIAEEVKKSSEDEPILEAAPSIEEVVDEPTEEEAPVADLEIISEEVDPVIDIGTSNVFKQIKTVVVKKQGGKRRRRRDDARGGGRQPKTKKLDRRKYLEYKYVVRDLLDEDNISEEHRSNLLGQIWAKGERIGVEESIAFIDQKVMENIIPESIAENLRRLVKKYTTKR